MKRCLINILSIGIITAVSGCGTGSDTGGQSGEPETVTISLDELRDKIAGGWAGKMIGVAYGAPTEFRWQGKIIDGELDWAPDWAANSFKQDDLYVQLSFMETMDDFGIDAPAEKFAESFATAGYRLWHANVQARKNFFDGIMPPLSGSPEYNLHADDIDFQIEADYIGFMSPGMPATACRIADKIGHIMNFGDGVYGGMFVAALYCEAFFEDDIPTIVDRALHSIPAESDYAKCIRDVAALHQHYPGDWEKAWQELESKWGEVDICGAMQPFNIDAKLNGAYIAMGLLYGEGDFGRTVEISTRCGQDSDCNPSNAAAVIGVIHGFSGIPDSWKSGIEPVADSLFIYTRYSFKSAVDNTVSYAVKLTEMNCGSLDGDMLTIKRQTPQAPPLEVSFPNTVPSYMADVFESEGWTFTGNWHEFKARTYYSKGEVPYAKEADTAGASATFTFSGTGVVIKGDWVRDGGRADVYLDGEPDRTIDTYYWWGGEDKRFSFLWHKLGLDDGEHTVRIVLNGDKNPDSNGTRVRISGATVFTTGSKKNETYKLSFEQ